MTDEETIKLLARCVVCLAEAANRLEDLGESSLRDELIIFGEKVQSLLNNKTDHPLLAIYRSMVR